MACPNCKCKVTYAYYEDEMQTDTDMEGCAHCGYIFYDELGLEDESIDILEGF